MGVSETEKAKTGIFYKLGVFSYRRNAKQAVGFYLAYLLLGLVLGFVVGAGTYLISGSTVDRQFGIRMGNLFAIAYCTVVSSLVLRAHGQTRDFGRILLVALSAALSVLAGMLLGLIPAAILSAGPVRDYGKSDTAKP